MCGMFPDSVGRAAPKAEMEVGAKATIPAET